MNLTPNARAAHWSAALIGMPWTTENTCWWLVKHVQRTQFGREMPEIQVGAQQQTPGQWGTIRDLVQRSGWHRTAAPWLEGDVLLMAGPDGPHVGVVVSRGRVLHSVGGLDEHGRPHGGVVLDQINELGRLGFGRLEGWRHA